MAKSVKNHQGVSTVAIQQGDKNMNSTNMKLTKVYDWPTRLFHWSFVVLFLSAFFISKVIDDDSPAYAYHMLLGFLLVGTVILRIIWGFIGSKYARFSSFSLKPPELLNYLKNLLLGIKERKLGHNPASAWAAIIMMALAIGLGVTGYLMVTNNNKEFFEDIHELMANAFIIVAIAHVAGVILHSLRHRDGIAFSMIHGQKKPVNGETGIAKSHAGMGLVYIVTLGTLVFYLGSNYNSGTQSLKLFGSTLNLGESKHEGSSHHGDHDKKHKHHDEEADSD